MRRRLPIRLKVTLAFTAAMAVVLAGLGLFIALTLRSDLDGTIDQGLRSRAADVSALVEQADNALTASGRSPLTERGESFAQLLDLRGAVVDSTPQVRRRALLTPGEIARAGQRTVRVEKAITGSEGSARLLAVPIRGPSGRRLVAVVGTSLESRDEALRELVALLLLGFPVALGLASLAGYGAAAAALAPVESMRRRAAEISAGRPGRRLPLPPAEDEVHRLGETLNAMLARLEAAFARERQFVDDASHELRTPLAILKAELELALRAGRPVAELRAALASAAEETDRLAQLAEDLLVLARSDEDGVPRRLASVQVGEVLEDVRARFAGRARELGRELVVSAAGELRVTADALRLEQALGNMVDNALRYGDGRVSLAAESGPDGVELHVRDEGEGFPPGFVASAFERFSRADHARGRGGSGLGLAIVAAIADAHGGSAHAGATEGAAGGGHVWLRLPDGAGPGRVSPPAPPEATG